MIVVLDKSPELYKESDSTSKRFFTKSPEQEKEYKNLILEELREELQRLNISPGYRLSDIGRADASEWDGGLCMHEEDGYWLIYHSERGSRSRPDIFTNIQSAANYFLWFHVSKPDGMNSDVGRLPRLKI